MKWKAILRALQHPIYAAVMLILGLFGVLIPLGIDVKLIFGCAALVGFTCVFMHLIQKLNEAVENGNGNGNHKHGDNGDHQYRAEVTEEYRRTTRVTVKQNCGCPQPDERGSDYDARRSPDRVVSSRILPPSGKG